MIVDSTCLARLVTEAREYALGLVIRRIVQPRHDLVALELGRAGPWQCLLIDWSPEFGRIHLAAEMPEPGLRDQRLGSTLRRQLRGARIERIEQIDYDRIVQIEFSNCEQLGPQCRRTLVAELMGRHSNLVLLDPDEQIVEAGKHVTLRVNRYRQTLPGLIYIPPPEFGRVPPREADAEAIATAAAAVLDQKLESFVRSSFHGGSDLFVAEVCARAQLDPAAALRDLPVGWAEALAQQIRAIPQEAAAPGDAWIYYDEAGASPDFAWPLDLQHLPERRRERCDSLSEALDELQRRIVRDQRERQSRERIFGALNEAEKKARRTLQKRQEAVRKASEAELDRERGELLMAWQFMVPTGAEEVTLQRHEHEGELTIPLDPNATAVEDAQAYFRRYRKSERMSGMAPKLLAAARHELEYIEQVRTQVELAEDVDDLRTIEEELEGEGYLKARREDRGRPARKRGDARRAETAQGYALLYGKSGHENDAVLRAAQPEDWWFHVKGNAGPHVVLRTDGRPDEVPEESLLEAATLAAALSSQRRDSKVEVDCTLAKNVNKPRRGRPGLAYYHAMRTFSVDPSSYRRRPQ